MTRERRHGPPQPICAAQWFGAFKSLLVRYRDTKGLRGSDPPLHLLADKSGVTALGDHRDKAYAHSIRRAGGFNACWWVETGLAAFGGQSRWAAVRSDGRAGRLNACRWWKSVGHVWSSEWGRGERQDHRGPTLTTIKGRLVDKVRLTNSR